MYKAYYYPTGREYFFNLRPKKADLIKALLDDGHYEEYIDVQEFDITKIKVITLDRTK